MRRHLSLILPTVVLAVAATPASAATLAAPVPQAPAAGATVQTAPPMTWARVKGAAQYDFQLAADASFGSIVDKGSFRTKNSAATIPGTLADAEYFWRVRALTRAGKAGKWSRVRSFRKAWTTAPELLEPLDALTVSWPASPLVLRWSPVPHATKYRVVVAADPNLATQVVGTVRQPVDTQGQTFAVPSTLTAGAYWWQITPIDADGHTGAPSAIGRFVWNWPSQVAGPQVLDVNTAEEVFDPLLTWKTVPGAARYDVEVSSTQEHVPGSRVFADTVVGTSVAPLVHLANNTYWWRVRAVDADGRAGAWEPGPVFKKQFDAVAPLPERVKQSVTGLRLENAVGPVDFGSTTESPMLSWAPVPGAAEYEVETLPYSETLKQCDYANPMFDEGSRVTRGPAIELANLTIRRPRDVSPGPASWPLAYVHDPESRLWARLRRPLEPGTRYCVRVLARDGAGVVLRSKVNDSEWTYFGGRDVPAFTFRAPQPVASGTTRPVHPTVGPDGVVPTVTRLPVLRWSPKAGARSYWVVVFRDAELTEVVEFGHTPRNFYVPHRTKLQNLTWSDEETNYYWVVLPSPTLEGTFPDSEETAVRGVFRKQSLAPEPQAPADGAIEQSQPVLRWSSAEGAASYRLQVARDDGFRDVVDDVETASTAYAAATTYPADEPLFWRVRAKDADGVELSWSRVRRFQRTLPMPQLDPNNPSEGERIPVLGWSAVDGAISYDMQVEQSDGTRKTFTLKSPRFTPVTFYGTGVWRWSVRANFPKDKGQQTVAGPFTPTASYLRRLLPPTGLKAVNTSGRVLLTWNPDVAARRYRVEASTTDSFATRVMTATVSSPAFAPDLLRGWQPGTQLYLRVAVVDEGNNTGAWAVANLRLPGGLNVRATAPGLRAKRMGTVTVRVTKSGRALRRALVRVSGLGVTKTARTNSRGVARLRVKPRRKGTMAVSASLLGAVGSAKVTVRR